MTAILTVDDLTDRFLAIAHAVLDAPWLGSDDDLAEHGGTSLALVRIVAVAHQTLGVDVDPRDLDGHFTVRGLARAARAVPPAG